MTRIMFELGGMSHALYVLGWHIAVAITALCVWDITRKFYRPFINHP